MALDDNDAGDYDPVYNGDQEDLESTCRIRG
jgi:hypothetical protein